MHSACRALGPFPRATSGADVWSSEPPPSRRVFFPEMTDEVGLTRDTQLSFVIELINGSKTMGDVEAHFRILNDE
jgi:hypothetical protein